MQLEKIKRLSLEEIRGVYRTYLQSLELGKNTIQTASNDTFYIWRNVSGESFWRVVESDNFEEEARNVLLAVLRKNSKGEPTILVNSYMSHMRRFLRFLHSDEEYQVSENKKTYIPKKRIAIDVPRPTTVQVENYLIKWDKLENYHLQEDALDKLFYELCPENNDISSVLIKVATLNDFYSTNIYSVYPVAKHILSLEMDERLKAGDVTLVNDIKGISINGVERNFYSFATKYCSHHNPLDYPIYDSYVEKILLYFRDKDRFADFQTNDLKDYVKFKVALINFRKFYCLEQYNLKQIDKYIWLLGKEYFPKNYGKSK